MKKMKKYIMAIMIVSTSVAIGSANPALAQTIPTIVSLPAAPTRAQTASLATNAVATAIKSGTTVAQVENTAAQQLLGNLNAPNALNPNGGNVTLAQAIVLVDNAAAQVSASGGVLTPVTLPPQPGIPGVVTINQVIPFTSLQIAILAQMTATAVQRAAALTPPTPVIVTPPVTPAPVQPTIQPPAFVPPTTIVSLPARPSVAQIKIFVLQAFIAAAQANPNGTLTQVQNAAAQSVLAFLNAPNAVNPNGGTATLAEALALVTPAIAGVTNVVVPQGVTVLQTLPPQPGVPGAVTVPVFVPFSPQVLSLLNQNAAATLITSQTAATIVAQPPVVAPVAVTVPVTPVGVTPPATTVTPATPVVTTPVTPVVGVLTPTAVTPVTTPAASGKAGNATLNFTVVPGTTLPQFTPDQMIAIGLPQCYPFCIPSTRPITGVVTPTGGKGVQLAGPVSPIIYKLVFKAGLPFIEQSGNGIVKALISVPIEFLTTTVQPVVTPPVVTPPVVTPVVTPPVTTPPTATNQNGQGSGKSNTQTTVQPVATQPATQTTPSTTTQSGNQGSGKSNTQTVVQPVTQPAATQTTPATTTQSGNQSGSGSMSGSGQSGNSGSKGKN
jgi:hypothetical protein